jgi:hypothetical protein
VSVSYFRFYNHMLYCTFLGVLAWLWISCMLIGLILSWGCKVKLNWTVGAFAAVGMASVSIFDNACRWSECMPIRDRDRICLSAMCGIALIVTLYAIRQAIRQRKEFYGLAFLVASGVSLEALLWLPRC